MGPVVPKAWRPPYEATDDKKKEMNRGFSPSCHSRGLHGGGTTVWWCSSKLVVNISISCYCVLFVIDGISRFSCPNCDIQRRQNHSTGETPCCGWLWTAEVRTSDKAHLLNKPLIKTTCHVITYHGHVFHSFIHSWQPHRSIYARPDMVRL